MSEPPVDRFRLHVLGAPDLRAPDGRRLGSVLSQPKRLALLTYLALAPEPVARGQVIATFWPGTDDARARNALSQALFHLRRALGEDVVESVEGDRLWAPPQRLWCDARALLTGGDATHPDELRASPSATDTGGSGDLLGGWIPDDALPLQEWLDEQRGRIRARRMPSAAPPPGPARAPISKPSPPPLASAIRRPILARPALVGGALVALALVASWLAASRLSGRASTQELAVLLPRVTTAPGGVELSPQVILDEVLAHLPHRDDVLIEPAPSASSIPDFRTQLATIGTPLEEGPDWVLEVSVRVTGEEAGVVGLLYRAPGFDVPGRESFVLTYDDADRVLVQVPREVGRGVAAMVERVLARR